MNELIELAKNGNEKAFTELFLNMKTELYSIARTRLKNETDIGDAVQETMIMVYKYIHTLKSNEFFKTWVIRILINECNRIYRRQQFKNMIFFYNSDVLERISDDKSINKAIEDLDFENLIQKLTYKERLIFTLYYKNKYKIKEIAEILNKNENTIKTIMRRAKEKLKNGHGGGK